YALELSAGSGPCRARELAARKSVVAAGGRVRGLTVPGGTGASRKLLDEIEGIARSAGAGGVMRLKRGSAGLEGPAAKFLSESGVQRLGVGEGELCLLVAGPGQVPNPALDRVPQRVGKRLRRLAGAQGTC